MSFTEVEEQGWFGRIWSSFTGIGCGMLLFLIAFPVLWWNEGRAIKEALGIAGGRKSIVEVKPDKVEAANEGKFIRVAGMVNVTSKVTDDISHFEAPVVRLRRKVEVYQWKETSKKETKKKIGGGQTTTTTYTYDKVWTTDPIKSSEFKESGHNNALQTLPFPTATLDSKDGKLGAFSLGEAVTHFEDFEPITIDKQAGLKPPDGFKVEARDLYKGLDSTKPNVDDIRVTFEAVPTGQYTILAAQKGDSFTQFSTPNKNFFNVYKGDVPADKIFTDMESSNNTLTWILRVVGFILMFIGISMALKPLSVMFDVLPFLGNMVEFGAALAAFTVAVPLTLITIAIAWVAHRPALGLGLLAVAGIGIYFARKSMKRQS